MRNKRLQLSAVLMLGLGLTGLQAQTMYVKQSNGTQTAYALSNVRKMTFSAGNATVQKSDNSTGVYALSALNNLSFEDFKTVMEEQILLRNVNFITYPNPVVNLLNIDLGAENKKGAISILSLEGKVMQKLETTGTGVVTLNLSQLPQGIYICRYANSTKIKTVKIIKQ